MKTMKATRINAGFYKLNYKGYKISIVHTNDLPNANWWYFTYIDLDDKHHGAEDTYGTKKACIESALEWVDYLITGVYGREILR